MEVIVVGLGVMGSHALWNLARQGIRATGIERFTPVHDRGASHGESRIIRSAYAEGAEYVPLVRRAWTLWRELERATGQSLILRTGGLAVGAPDAAFVAGARASADAHGLPYELLPARELRRRHPLHRIADGIVGLHEHDAGVIRAEPAVRAAIDAATALGAELLPRTSVTDVVPDPDRPRVRLAGPELAARHVIVAAGAWSAGLVPSIAARLRPVRRVMGWFRVTDPGYAPGRFPVFLRDLGEGRTLYGFPSLDGETVKLALHNWPGIDEPVDPATGPRAPDRADAARLSEIVGSSLGGLEPEPVRMKACTYTLTPDEHFLIGGRPELPGLTLLGGFSGHGFKFAPAIGEIAAQLARTGRSSLPIDLFDPRRL